MPHPSYHSETLGAMPAIIVDPGLDRFFAEFQPNAHIFSAHLRPRLADEAAVAATTIHFSDKDNAYGMQHQHTGALDPEANTIHIYPLRLLRNEILPNLDKLHEIDPDGTVGDALATAIDISSNHELFHRVENADPRLAAEVAEYNTTTSQLIRQTIKHVERRNGVALTITEAGLLAAEIGFDTPWLMDTAVFIGTLGLAVWASARQAQRKAAAIAYNRYQIAPHEQRAIEAEQNGSDDFVTLRLKPDIENDPGGFYHRWQIARA